jgi:hypothetical protein
LPRKGKNRQLATESRVVCERRIAADRSKARVWIGRISTPDYTGFARAISLRATQLIFQLALHAHVARGFGV